MNVQLFLVQAWTRAAVPIVLETTRKFAKEAEPLAQVQIPVQEVSLQRIYIAGRRARPVRIADVFAAFPNPYAKSEIVLFAVTTKRDEFQAVQELGTTSRIAEILIVFVIRHLRKGRGWARATSFRLLLCLRPSAAPLANHHSSDKTRPHQ